MTIFVHRQKIVNLKNKGSFILYVIVVSLNLCPHWNFFSNRGLMSTKFLSCFDKGLSNPIQVKPLCLNQQSSYYDSGDRERSWRLGSKTDLVLRKIRIKQDTDNNKDTKQTDKK